MPNRDFIYIRPWFAQLVSLLLLELLGKFFVFLCSDHIDNAVHHVALEHLLDQLL
mgnify:CR=1 FL=1